MKKNCILLLLSVAIAGAGCKKEEQPTTPPAEEKVVIVTTIAGNGDNIPRDGVALSAGFAVPYDVAVTADGTVYVADAGSHRIRKISAGQVSAFAGNGTNGIVNGTGTQAEFKAPFRITMDTNGNLFTLDVIDPRIRKISPAAEVTTYAGTAIPGLTNGTKDIAQFRMNEGSITADPQGNIYGADYANHSIRKISIDGQVTTIAGTGEAGFKDGEAGIAKFNYPTGIAIDKQGNLYIVDGLNLRIRKITSDGQVSTLTGNGSPGLVDGDAGTAQFTYIEDMIIDSKGNLFVADGNSIRKITPQGVVHTIAGGLVSGYKDGEGKTALFDSPVGLAVDAQDNIYVADLNNLRIRKISFE